MRRRSKFIFVPLAAAVIIMSAGCGKNTSKNVKSDTVEATKNMKKLPITKLLNWEKETIGQSIEDSQWDSTIIRNNTYLFYIDGTENLIRVNQYTKKKVTIKKLEGAKDGDTCPTALAISNNQIYYLYKNVIYQCDFNGNHSKKIVAGDDLQDVSKNQRRIDGFQMYQGKLFLLVSGWTGQYDTSSKKFNVFGEDIDDSCFYENYFYYTSGRESIYRVNIHSLKQELVRKRDYERNLKGSDKKIRYYNKLMVVDGKLYYAAAQGGRVSEGGEGADIYLYREKKADQKVLHVGDNLIYSVQDGDVIGYEEGDYIKTLNIKTGAKTKKLLPNDVQDLQVLIGDMLVYIDNSQHKYKTMELDVKEEKTSKEKLLLSELIDWKNEKVMRGKSEGGSSLITTDSYIFYANSKFQIVRVDRRSKEKVILVNLKKSVENRQIGMAVSKDKLYYIYDESLYECSLDGKKQKKIMDAAKAVEMNSKLDDPSMDGIYVYQNKIYIMFGGLIVTRVNPDTKKVETVAEDVRSNMNFYKNGFYYFDVESYGIKKVDLNTLKEKYVRGQEWTKKLENSYEKVLYKNIIVKNGKLYYLCDKGEESLLLYQYEENGKDTKTNPSEDWLACDRNPEEMAWEEYDSLKEKSSLYLYYMKTKDKKKIDLPDKLDEIELIQDNMLLYTKKYDDEMYSVLKMY
ncbi:MAG: hypothetical protein PHD56_05995 [Anaerostipes sp.]|nr:hypothetical protein [Anaerostipes sp.]